MPDDAVAAAATPAGEETPTPQRPVVGILFLLLIVFVPGSLALALMHAPPAWCFLGAALAIVPLAGYIGQATEQLAKHLGATLGGLLNATFGNATELIITIFAVRANQIEVVRASLIGSIIGNLLLVLGMAAFFGGLKYRQQRFNGESAGSDIIQLFLAVIAMLTPSLFVMGQHYAPVAQVAASDSVESLSLGIAGLLIVLYAGSLIFSLRTHQDLYCVQEEIDSAPPSWSKARAFVILAAATLAVAYESEVLVDSIQPTIAVLHLTPLFVGVILVPIIGNAAEHATAVTMAMRNRMDVALGICTSSSAQIALFVGPVIVFLSIPLGHRMPFLFNTFELITVSFAVLIANLIARDGKTNWFEGAQLLVAYGIFGLAFYFVR